MRSTLLSVPLSYLRWRRATYLKGHKDRLAGGAVMFGHHNSGRQWMAHGRWLCSDWWCGATIVSSKSRHAGGSLMSCEYTMNEEEIIYVVHRHGFFWSNGWSSYWKICQDVSGENLIVTLTGWTRQHQTCIISNLKSVSYSNHKLLGPAHNMEILYNDLGAIVYLLWRRLQGW
jgi:ribosomal protein S8